MNPADAYSERGNRVKMACRKRSCHVRGEISRLPGLIYSGPGTGGNLVSLRKVGIWFDHFPCMFTRIMHGIKGKRRIQIYLAFFESRTGV